MKKTAVTAFLSLTVIVLAILVGFRQSGAAQEILVGAAWPFAANQDGMDEGLLLAQEEINVRGVAGRQIRLLLRDDQLDRRQARAIAVDFARNPRMVATIGYYDDKLAVRSSAIFEASGLLHIVAGANNTYMTTHGFRYLIRSVMASDRIGRRLAHMCIERGYRNFAIIAEDGAFGEDLAYQIEIELDARNAHVVHQTFYVRGKVDFRETVDVLKAAGADVILFLGLEAESAQFIKSARGLGLKTPIVGSFSDTPEMHAIAGKALEGVMFYDMYDVNSPAPENRAFVSRFRRRFGKDPQTYAAQGYDALRILARAIETTGSTNHLDLAYAIRYMERWEGANGWYKFDSTGELEEKELFLKVYRGLAPVVIAVSHPEAQIAKTVR